MVRLELTEAFLETMGDSSILGLILSKIGKCPPEGIEFIFFETSNDWRKKHQGARGVILPEYAMRCLTEQILEISALCPVKISHEVRDP